MAPRTPDPYAVLGIRPGASRADAARAHRRLAKEFHPDVNPGPAAADRMRRINEAWRILSNPTRRAEHDASGRAAAWAGPAHWSQPGAGAGAATWTTWSHPPRGTGPRSRRPSRPAPVEPSFGDRPVVFITAWVVLSLLVFIGTWLGSVAP